MTKQKIKSDKKYKWEIVARDFNSPFIRNYIWVKSLYKFPELFGVTRAVLGIVSKKDTIEYIGDLNTWNVAHKDVKKLILKDNYYLGKHIDKTNQYGEMFNKWSEKNIFQADLKSASNKKLADLLKSFVEKQATLYAYGIILPILDFQGFSFVENNLKKFLKNKARDQKEYAKYFEIFTQPIKNSFAREQEEDLLRLMGKFYNKKWADDISHKNLTEIKKLHSTFFKALSSHTKKYAWVYYVYAGPAFTEQGFLNFIKDYVKQKMNPSKKLVLLKEKEERIRKLRFKYIRELKPDKFNAIILKLAGRMVWAKPRRKDYQSKSYYHFEKLLQEISRRLFISLSQTRSLPVEQIEKSLNKEKADLNKINSIYNLHICLPKDNGTVQILHGKQAQQFYSKEVKKVRAEKLGNIKTLRGTPAQAGKAKGAVRIVNVPADMQKMLQGNILVAIATNPGIVPAMKKAAAILTDEGGLTCHAAIVSRELEIPCVVGLKIVSKTLKDGDLVEVDANNGIIKRL